MSLTDPSLDTEGPPPAAPPGPIVQSAAIGFRVIFFVTLVLGAVWLVSNFRVLSPENQGVVMRFGRVVHTQRTGILIAFPRPIDEVRILPGPQRRLIQQVGALLPVEGIVETSSDANAKALPATSAPYLTGDGNVVMLDAKLNYRISDPVAYVLREPHVSPAMDRLFRATAVNVAASQSLNDFLVAQSVGGSTSLSMSSVREQVRQRLLSGVNARLKALDAKGVGLGVEIQRIDLTAQLPPAAKIAYDNVLTAGQKADQNIAAAQRAAELRRQGAQQEATRITTAAQAAALERTAQASTDTISITAIQKAAGSARTGLEEQAFRSQIGGVLNKAGSVIVVDPDSGQRILTNGPGARAK